MNGGRKIRSRQLLGVLSLLLATAFTVGALTDVIGPGMFSGGGRAVRAVFANPQQLKAGDEVRVHGVLEGTVDSVKLDPGARSATVDMTIDNSAGPLYRDATATLRWKTLLGGAFYVDLAPGDPSTGSLGSNAIPASNTANQVEVQDVLSIDQGSARTGLQAMPGELGTALSNPHPPAQVFGTLARVAPFVTTGVGAVRGQVQDSDLRSLMSASAATVQALNSPTDEIRGVVAGAAATLDTMASHSADIQSLLIQAPPTMQQTRLTLRQLQTTLRLTNRLLNGLYRPAVEVGPTLAQLHPTVVGANRLLNRAVPLLYALRPAVTSLAAASRSGLPLLTALTPSLDRLAGTILPYLNQTDPATKHTTAEMIGPTMAALGPDISGQEDQNGHFIRFPATGGSSPFYLPCQEYYGNPDKKNYVECESLQQALNAFLSYSPLGPPPGSSPPPPPGATRP